MSKLFGYSRPANEILTDAVNNQLGKNFTYDALSFGPVTRYKHDGFVSIAVDTNNSDKYIGTSSIRIKRVDIGMLLRGIDLTVSVPLATSSLDLLPAINARYKLNLTEDDVYASTITPGVTSEVDLIIKPTSLLWEGGVRVALIPAPEALNVIVVPGSWTDLTYYKDTDINKAIAELKFGYLDATTHRELLADLELGSVLGALGEIGGWITTEDPTITWVIVPDAHLEYNLYGSYIEYNGANDGVYSIGGSTFSKVCVVNIGEYCSNLTGRLVLAYN